MTFADLTFTTRHWDQTEAATAQFANGYGASVIRGPGTYGFDRGLYELAVICNDNLCYDTPVTDDVLGHLTEDEVTKVLADIAALPSREAVQ